MTKPQTQQDAISYIIDHDTRLETLERNVVDIGISGTSGSNTAYSTTIGDGATTSFTITHNLGCGNNFVCAIWDLSTGDQIIGDIVGVGLNSFNLNFATAPTTNNYRVVVLADGSTTTLTNVAFQNAANIFTADQKLADNVNLVLGNDTDGLIRFNTTSGLAELIGTFQLIGDSRLFNYTENSGSIANGGTYTSTLNIPYQTCYEFCAQFIRASDGANQSWWRGEIANMFYTPGYATDYWKIGEATMAGTLTVAGTEPGGTTGNLNAQFTFSASGLDNYIVRLRWRAIF